jgi:hypothetical protein
VGGEGERVRETRGREEEKRLGRRKTDESGKVMEEEGSHLDGEGGGREQGQREGER